jgi:YaiO family outer membrane protein
MVPKTSPIRLKHGVRLASLVSILLIVPGTILAAQSDGCPIDAAVDTQNVANAPSDGIDTDARFDRARELTKTRSYSKALEEYRILLAVEPGNVDYLFGSAQALFWSGETDTALRCLDLARGLAPDYEDLWAFQLGVLNSRPGITARRLSEEFRAEAQSRFPDADWLSRQPPAITRYRWELGIDREYLDNGSPDWNGSYAYVGRRSDSGTLVYLTAATCERFGLRDAEFGIGSSFEVARAWFAAAALSISSAPNFLASSTVDVSVGRKFHDGWVLGLRGRSRNYADIDVTSVAFDVERYFGRFRLGYSIDNARLANELTVTHKIVFGFYAESGSQIGLTVATGEEAEVVNPGQLLKTTINAFALSGRYPINDYLSVVWRLGTHRQGSIYRRNNIGVSIAGGF